MSWMELVNYQGQDEIVEYIYGLILGLAENRVKYLKISNVDSVNIFNDEYWNNLQFNF